MKSILLSLLVICTSTSLTAQSLKAIQLKPEVVERLGLESAKLQKNIISDPISATAVLVIDPANTQSVASFFSGQVSSKCLTLGDKVAQNSSLLTLRSREVAAIVSEYIKTSSRLKSTKLIYEREESLRAKKLTTGDAYLAAKMNYEESAASHAAALQIALLAKSRSELDKLGAGQLAEDGENSTLQILSPLTGTITEKYVTTGAAVEENQQLYQIADLTQLLVKIKLPLQAVGKIKLGDELMFKTVIGERRKGIAQISKISPEIDSSSLTLQVFATLDNSQNEWLAGTPVGVEIIDTAEKPRLSIPSSGVVRIADKDCVFIDAGSAGYQPVEITTGLKSQRFVEVLDGLESDAKIVVKGASLLLAAWEVRASE